MMQYSQNLERLLSLEEDRADKRSQENVSEGMQKAIDETREKIRGAFQNGKPIKAKLKATDSA